MPAMGGTNMDQMNMGTSMDVQQYGPLSVHVANLDELNKRPKEVRVSHHTYVLTASNPYLQIAQYDPCRTELHVEPIANDVVLSGSISQASDANNLAATIANPNGRILSHLVGEYIVPGQNEAWVSVGTYPTMVGVSIVREI
jgi:hypothetical protein